MVKQGCLAANSDRFLRRKRVSLTCMRTMALVKEQAMWALVGQSSAFKRQAPRCKRSYGSRGHILRTPVYIITLRGYLLASSFFGSWHLCICYLLTCFIDLSFKWMTLIKHLLSSACAIIGFLGGCERQSRMHSSDLCHARIQLSGKGFMLW
jgi:hypothetical protein